MYLFIVGVITRQHAVRGVERSGPLCWIAKSVWNFVLLYEFFVSLKPEQLVLLWIVEKPFPGNPLCSRCGCYCMQVVLPLRIRGQGSWWEISPDFFTQHTVLCILSCIDSVTGYPAAWKRALDTCWCHQQYLNHPIHFNRRKAQG